MFDSKETFYMYIILLYKHRAKVNITLIDNPFNPFYTTQVGQYINEVHI